MRLDLLIRLRTRIEAVDRERDALMRERDRLILKAIDEGYAVVDIVEAAGVTRARVYQIKNEHSDRKA